MPKATTKKTTTKAAKPKKPVKTTKNVVKAAKSTRTARSANGSNSSGSLKDKDLVVVESPAKARTLGRFLGDKYTVKASMGHIRDLPQKDLGIDIDRDFQPSYAVVKDKAELVRELKRAAREAQNVYFATDPDREGEAISWHLANAVEIDPLTVRRVVFHEITEDAVRHAFQTPRALDMELVNAQQARRILDRLVGYKISPILWRKVRRGLSAGRVQSAALRLIVDREREIVAFVPVEYWSIEADLSPYGTTDRFTARLDSLIGKKGKLDVPDRATAEGIVRDLEKASYAVGEVRKREVHRRPAAPFITSTLQQEAWRKLRFSARKTMSVAQQLYEGLSIGADGPVGLITYMRTDSTNLAAEATQAMRELIGRKYGKEYVPDSPRVFTRKVKGAQEAHEAIRPTSFTRDPESIKDFLDSDQFKLYDLVWKRALASQMSDAALDQSTIDTHATRTPSGEGYVLRSTGSVLTFPGFLAIYQEGQDEPEEADGGRLPDVREGQALALLQLRPDQHFTQPPPRYNDATIVKALEERGIGRPSTYAPIISTLLERGYVRKDEGRFHPEKLGMVVNDLLVDHFPNIVDMDFTAHLEEELDEIAEGEKQMVPVLREFYAPFEETVQRAITDMPRVKGSAMDEPTDEICDVCGKPMVIKSGRFGKFLACTGFPECRNTRNLARRIEHGCPVDGGDLVERKARKTGRGFYGCANYPSCTFLTNSRPLDQACPECGGTVVAEGKENAKCLRCAWTGTREELGAEVSEVEA
jgi:DNA topoisomerase-1